MKDDKETKEKLIDSAKKEFLEKGYNKASLRKICADAGVTTGALYFFFKDKEDLFDSIVRKPYEELGIMIQEHVDEDIELLSVSDSYVQEDGDHNDLVEKLIHHIYSNRDAFILLTKKAGGTRYAGAQGHNNRGGKRSDVRYPRHVRFGKVHAFELHRRS